MKGHGSRVLMGWLFWARCRFLAAVVRRQIVALCLWNALAEGLMLAWRLSWRLC